MQNPQEQTEAKLLAYIEGDLDEAARAEIERHILANPKHRKLLDELSAGRRLVRLLPREVAPIELFESVQSQLERQELLLGAADMNPETGNVRLNRWGQIRAAAALVLLTTGLGIIAYNAVPQRASRQAAQSLAPVPASNLARAEPAISRDSAGDTRVAVANRPLGAALSEATAPSDLQLRMASAANSARKSMAVREALEGKAAKPDSAAGASANAAPTTAPSAAEPIYLVVASKDLSIARQQVAAILNDNGLAYSQIAPGTAGPLSPARPLMEEQPQENAAGDAGSGGGAPAGEKTPQLSKSKVADRSDTAQDTPGKLLDSKPSVASVPTAAPMPAVKQPAAPTPDEEVLIVRRVPRSRASQLVAALNQPSADRYAFTFGGAAGSGGQSDNKRYRRDPQNDAVDGAIASQPAAATTPKAPIADSSQTHPATLPAAPPLPSTPSPAARFAATTPTTRFEIASKVGKPAVKEPAPSGIVAQAPADVAATRDAESLAERPIEVNEAVELVYLDIRRAAQPLVRPTRVSSRGSIIVAGYGEFSLAGLTPKAATQKLSVAMREKSPASKGVEIRRPTVDPTLMAQAAPPAMPAPATGPQDALPAQTPTASGTTPMPKPTASSPLPAASSLPAPVQAAAPATPIIAAPQSAPTVAFGSRSAPAEELFVDIVIVLQRDTAAAPTP